MSTLSSVPEESIAKTKHDWSTPYDEWLIPILNRYRYGGAIECRAIPSEIQLLINQRIKSVLDELVGELDDGKNSHSIKVIRSAIQKIRSRYE